MSQSVAVIGGSGFIGRSIAAALAMAGHRVVILDLVPPRGTTRTEFREFDMTRVRADQLQAWDAVVIAAGALARTCKESPQASFELNVLATLDVIARLSTMPGPPRIIFLSSGMVYDGNGQPPFVETAATKPSCLYTASKLAVEQCLAAATYATPLKALILRPFTVYGRDGIAGDRGHLFGRWLEMGARGECLKVFGDGGQVIDPVPVDILGAACVRYLAALPSCPLLTVNVTSGGYCTILRLAQLFVATGLAPGLEFAPAPGDDARRGWGSPRVLERLLGRHLASDPEAEVAEFLRAIAYG